MAALTLMESWALLIPSLSGGNPGRSETPWDSSFPREVSAFPT